MSRSVAIDCSGRRRRHMALISIEKKHTMDRETVKSRAQEALASMAKRYGFRGEWEADGYTYRIKSPGTGTCVVTDGAVKVEIDTLPFLLAALKDVIAAQLATEIDNVLSSEGCGCKSNGCC